MRKHLAILKFPYLKAVIVGQKTIETRLTRTKRQPFGQIDVGDFVYLKQASGPICATAKVAVVKIYENLDRLEIDKIKKLYNKQICGSQSYWQSKTDCRYGLLIWLKDVKKIPPVSINKKDQRAWVVLSKDLNYGLEY
jgi:ASC-1-like (ASCH) protein